MGLVSGGLSQYKMKTSNCFSIGIFCMVLLCLSTHAYYLTDDVRPSSIEEHSLNPSSGFGVGVTMIKRRPEMGAQGFIGDNLSGGFGHFYTMKRGNSRMTTADSKVNAFLNLLEHSQE